MSRKSSPWPMANSPQYVRSTIEASALPLPVISALWRDERPVVTTIMTGYIYKSPVDIQHNQPQTESRHLPSFRLLSSGSENKRPGDSHGFAPNANIKSGLPCGVEAFVWIASSPDANYACIRTYASTPHSRPGLMFASGNIAVAVIRSQYSSVSPDGSFESMTTETTNCRKPPMLGCYASSWPRCDLQSDSKELLRLGDQMKGMVCYQKSKDARVSPEPL